MFEKFGEFGSVEELNRAAEGLLKEGDTDSLRMLAEENGIEKEDTGDYIAGEAPGLATLYTAAFGRLAAEEKEAAGKNSMEKMALSVIFSMLRGMCMEESMAEAVMQKGKRAANVLEAMKKEAEAHKSGNMGVSCGTDRELCTILQAYYMEPEKAFLDAIKALYR